MINALIVEDHALTRQWIAQQVQSAFAGIQITEAMTLQQAQFHIPQINFNLALVDINLPDGSGIDFIKVLAEHINHCYIVMCTIFDDSEHLFKALRAGAHGYLIKDQSESLFINKLQGIVKGDPPLSPGIARKLLDYHRTPKENVNAKVKDDMKTLLSHREEEVITLLAKGMTTKEIALLLNITPNTTAGYIKNVYRKLNVSSRAEASLEAVNLGLVNSS